MSAKQHFEELVIEGPAWSLADTIKAAQAGDEPAQGKVVSAMVWAAFSAPDGVRPLYDAITEVWLGAGDVPADQASLPSAPLPAEFWDAFWSAVDQARATRYTPASATARVADLSCATHPDFLELAERVAQRHVPAGSAFREAATVKIDPAFWSRCAAGTLGHELHQMIDAGQYDLEIGSKRELRTLPPTLNRLTTHVDSLDGAWRLVAGYDVVDSHLIAFAAFCLAQCGHLFSASALAVFAAIAHFVLPHSFHILMYLIAEGWRHGQQSPTLLDIDWDAHWSQPVAALRERYSVPVYGSVFGKNLFRTLPRYGGPSGEH
ncbi:MAG: hypothetical protein OXJ53_12765 [Gammaproteobacteria bacterium]|nr:hypothetical protein [Gammaproteobacteria bacterium]